ncbi:MAG TPA: hypothetical protein VFP65_26690 [Anaeromyxobacteraceae bacterium]|nr:hypothetical protein [Anaeromyxobacteraceae bacterium]
MDADLQKFVEFLEQQTARQAPHFPSVRFDKVLSFMGTTSQPGQHAAVAVTPVLGLDPAAAGRELRVRLRGPLPRLPARGECVTVHLTNVEQYQGYQVKTRPLATTESVGDLFEASGPELAVAGAHIFTVHLSPYTMKFFEQIPYEEVQLLVGGVRYALVAVGQGANLSPRFIFHHEVRNGRPVLYHGDGLALKTYMNLKSNRSETRLVLDLEGFDGWRLEGTVEEFQPHQHPEAYEKICGGFNAGSWGKPSRTFRFTAERWTPIAPTAPAGQRPSRS